MSREPDIVERLRDIAGEWADAEIREEAADEIERLLGVCKNKTALLKDAYAMSQENEIKQERDRYARASMRFQIQLARLQEAMTQELGYATRLAEALWEKHWKTEAPDWKPLPDLLGVLTQIDNMTAGLVRALEPKP